MQMNEISIGKTYFGPLDYLRGHGSHRTVIDIGEYSVSFRNEVGKNPPDCYVAIATMDKHEFAKWAEKDVPTPPRAN